MVATAVRVAQLVAQLAAEAQTVKTVNLIGLIMDLSAAIQRGMSMALIALHLNLNTIGIAQAVAAQVMDQLSVVMETVQAMKITTTVQKTATLLVSVMMVM